MNHDINYGLWVIVMCQWRFTGHNQSPSLPGMLMMKEAVHIGGLAGGMWEISESALHFFCKLETALQKKVIIKKLFALGMKNPITN